MGEIHLYLRNILTRYLYFYTSTNFRYFSKHWRFSAATCSAMIYCYTPIGESAWHSPTYCSIKTTTIFMHSGSDTFQRLASVPCANVPVNVNIAYFLKYISTWNCWKLVSEKTCLNHTSLFPAVLWLFFPLLASIINKPHGSLHLLIAAATVIWHRCLQGLAFTQKTGRTFLFLILVNLFAISWCQTDARAKSISFTQEWLGHARVNHSQFIISAAADAFLVRQLRDVGVDRLKGQVQLERSSRLSCNNYL